MSVKTRVLDNISSIAPLPVVAARLAELLKDPDVAVNKLVETVRYDPGLTARLISLANSVFFGSTAKVENLRDAIVRVGNKQLLSVVIGSSVKPILEKPLDGYELEHGDLWRHSVGTAVAAELIEKRIGGSMAEEAFTAGILHDVGKLAMSDVVEDYSEKICALSHMERNPFDRTEQEIMGFDHMEAGAQLLANWGMTDKMVAVARWHHSPDSAREHQHLVDVVHLADSVTMTLGLGIGLDGTCYDICEGSFTRLGMDENSLLQVAADTLDELIKVNRMFNS